PPARPPGPLPRAATSPLRRAPTPARPPATPARCPAPVTRRRGRRSHHPAWSVPSPPSVPVTVFDASAERSGSTGSAETTVWDRVGHGHLRRGPPAGGGQAPYAAGRRHGHGRVPGRDGRARDHALLRGVPGGPDGRGPGDDAVDRDDRDRGRRLAAAGPRPAGGAGAARPRHAPAPGRAGGVHRPGARRAEPRARLLPVLAARGPVRPPRPGARPHARHRRVAR